MRLILVRHGDAHAGFHGVIGGQSGCTGLTDLGRAQAEALRAYLGATGRVQADVLLASVLPRAIETASIIAPGLGLEIAGQECDLCEVHTGEADGLTWTEYAARYGAFDMEAEPDRVFAPAGESWNSFHQRVQGTLERVARDYDGQSRQGPRVGGHRLRRPRRARPLRRAQVLGLVERPEHPVAVVSGGRRGGLRLGCGPR